MPRLTTSAPKYRHHKPSGQAVVTLNDKDHYLGKFNSKASKQLYDRLIGEWLAGGRQSLDARHEETSVAQLIHAFVEHAKVYYRNKQGEPTGTFDAMKPILRELLEHYGDIDVRDFGPLSLKRIQQLGIEAGHSRRYINDNTNRIRQVFRWGVSEELIDESIHRALQTVANLKPGKSDARETEPVGPVPDEIVEETIVSLTPIVRDMVKFQRLTGARPGEVCRLKPREIVRAGEIWIFQPHRHKTEHLNKTRIIPVGPKAQACIQPYLDRDSDEYCFRPAEAVEAHHAARHKARKTPPGQGNCRKRTQRSRRKLNTHYSTDSYRKAIQRACERVTQPPMELRKRQNESVAEHHARLNEKQRRALQDWEKTHRWSPNQLRHAMATATRERYGLEGVMATLGHTNPTTSEIYAERNITLAREVARMLG